MLSCGGCVLLCSWGCLQITIIVLLLLLLLALLYCLECHLQGLLGCCGLLHLLLLLTSCLDLLLQAAELLRQLLLGAAHGCHRSLNLNLLCCCICHLLLDRGKLLFSSCAC
jgi:hypothetical protein